MTRRLPLRLISLDFQPAGNLDPETVASYVRRMKRHEGIEPVVVCHDGVTYWLKDGFHRFEAVRSQGHKTITAEIIPGTLAEMEAEFQLYLAVLKSELRNKPAKG